MPLIQPVLAPTNITNGNAFVLGVLPGITTLADGQYALTFAAAGGDVFWSLFDPHGQPIAGGAHDNIGSFPVIVGLSGGGFALASESQSFGQIFTAVHDAAGSVTLSPYQVGHGFENNIAALANDRYVIAALDPSTPADQDLFIAIHDAAGVVLSQTNITNTPDFDEQIGRTSVAVLANGNFAVVWGSGVDGTVDLATAVYTPDGVQITAPYNPSPTDGIAVVDPEAAALANGGYAAVWTGEGAAVLTAVYDASGQELVAPFAVPGAVGGDVRIAGLDNGNYVVSWGFTDAQMAIYSADGQPVSGVVNVNGTAPAGGSLVQITPLSSGDVAFTWEGVMPDFSTDVFTSVFDAQGNELIAAFNVTNSPGVFDTFPAVTALANDAYAITWNGGAEGDQFHAVYQFVDVPLTEIQPATNISNDGVSFEPKIATLANGNYALTYNDGADVVWTVFDPQGQAIIGGGVPQGGVELSPAIAPVTGGFALAWEDAIAGGIYTAVFEEDGTPYCRPRWRAAISARTYLPLSRRCRAAAMP